MVEQVENRREVAGQTLSVAFEAVMKQRQDQHGNAEDSFQMIGELWEVYLKHAMSRREGFRMTGLDVAQMMVLLKIGRATFGDSTNIDHYADAAGYAALGAMLGGVPMPVKEGN